MINNFFLFYDLKYTLDNYLNIGIIQFTFNNKSEDKMYC